jgi:hypothetical protein
MQVQKTQEYAAQIRELSSDRGRFSSSPLVINKCEKVPRNV